MTGALRVPNVSVLFCDLVGSTALLEELGEARNDERGADFASESTEHQLLASLPIAMRTGQVGCYFTSSVHGSR